MAPPRSPYVDRNGLVHRCFSCGAFRNNDEPARWDLLASRPGGSEPVSHVLCEPCFRRDHGEPTGGWTLGSLES